MPDSDLQRRGNPELTLRFPPLKRLARILLPCVATFFLAQVYAADSEPARLSTITADGSSTSAEIAIGLSTDGGNTFVSEVDVGSEVEISATIYPDDSRLGSMGDIFIVQRIGDTWTQKNIDGNFVTWNLSLKTLEPVLENISLEAAVQVPVFSGELSGAGSYRFFVGFMPAGGSLVFNPTAARFESVLDAFSFFESNIADQIVAARCVVCHVSGGIADGQTDLLYDADASRTQENFDILSDFFFATEDATDYILSKASGGDSHVGGIQLPAGSSDYLALEQFLLLLEGGGGSYIPPGGDQGFFDAIVLEDSQETLRSASMLLAARLPTEAELLQVADGSEESLRAAVRGMMEGENFHDFLLDGANDRLLVRGLGIEPRIIRECIICFPEFSNTLYEVEKLGIDEGLDDLERSLNRQVDKAMIEAPLELIAYVVENELPYSEILTADYQMLTPLLNDMLGGTAVFDNPGDKWEYQPGRVEGMYLIDPLNIDFERDEDVTGVLINDPGSLQTDLPHAGVLNSRAFLTRYPTTATNRNRARSRWTYYHFLDVDIERSAQRTTDPEALADTDNPTMNNSNCTICHERMDPVAGTFQNYAPQGQYRLSFFGTDSLDNFYKNPEDGSDTLYQEGDTWYRDMREPGYGQALAPDADNSIQWLAQEIASDPGFLTATVKFWWPAVIGSDILLAPEVTTDADYSARLMAFDAQNGTIGELAEEFGASGMNLKDLLVELVMSPWFRAESVDSAALGAEMRQAHEIAALGNEKLLTPEQLQRKTTTLTGFTWLNGWNIFSREQDSNAFDRFYGLYYGGIDSSGVIKRSRQMTTMMGTVPIVHALEVSCPIVLREFILPDAERRLFGGLSENVTPASLNGEAAIRAKLVELHEILLGESHAADAPEIDAAYDLYVASWEERRNSQVTPSLFNEVDYCPFFYDIYSGQDLPYEGEDLIAETRGDGKPVLRQSQEFIAWMFEQGADPNYTKQAWRTVMVYLLSHYDYLYE